jgi:hypothetical protein
MMVISRNGKKSLKQEASCYFRKYGKTPRNGVGIFHVADHASQDLQKKGPDLCDQMGGCGEELARRRR